MKKTVLLVLFAAGSAVAQQKPPAEDKPASPPPQRPLNLKLDDAARYTREEPAAKSGDNLPALGGSNPALWDKARELRPESSNNPYPKDTQRQN